MWVERFVLVPKGMAPGALGTKKAQLILIKHFSQPDKTCLIDIPKFIRRKSRSEYAHNDPVRKNIRNPNCRFGLKDCCKTTFCLKSKELQNINNFKYNISMTWKDFLILI